MSKISNQGELDLISREGDLFHFDENRVSFEDFGHENGFRFWYARDFMGMLGYTSFKSFEKALNKAMTTCATLNIGVMDNFEQVQTLVDGEAIRDYKLSKFACYLVAMNGDTSKKAVAHAQAYFATLAEAFQRHLQLAEDVERVLIREEITDHEKSLSATADEAGVSNYAFFQNAGYRGMYNMNLNELKKHKGIDTKNSLLDFMGKQELAAKLISPNSNGGEGSKREYSWPSQIGKGGPSCWSRSAHNYDKNQWHQARRASCRGGH